GGTIMVCWEGTRPLLVEVQSLVAESYGQQPRRVALGLDTNRLALILAVLQRHGGILLHQQDVYTNVVGGLKIQETASDLALIAALLSSHLHCSIPKDVAIFGEIGLSGEIRPVPHGQQRIQEAAKHGISHVIIPQANAKGLKVNGVKIQTVGTVKESVQVIKSLMKETVT
ncbi:MAG: magnesium chelatase domain-containing protein, partial [Gammaproteobacteria bacterium]|nr:magnesium chelatase domain-containing protein [Gammaproteobacteria bacterium]